MHKTWVVFCPSSNDSVHTNRSSGWSLSTSELKRIENDYYAKRLKCQSCGNSFSLWEGVGAFYVFSDSLMADFFIHNGRERGVIDVDVGKAVRLSFANPFEDTPRVNVTPQFDVYAAPTMIGKQGFTLLTCFGGKGESIGKISWFASGTRREEVAPIWRGLLSNAKEHQLAKNYRSEIVELDSAFEVFVGEYLSNNLKEMFAQEIITWVLNQHNIGEPLEIGFILLNGKPLEKLYSEEYHVWKKHVRKKRNDIVHRGLGATKKDAEDARKATFDIMTKIDNSVLPQFQVELNLE